MLRSQLIQELVQLITSIKLKHPIRVAIDGIDAAGKTILANELVAPLEAQGRHVIRASIDGFHHPRDIRYRHGPNSPEGYYLDSFNYEAIKTLLLQPLGSEGDRQYRLAVFDFRTNSHVSSPICQARADSILLFDGVFLLRPELYEWWDFTLFLDVEFDLSVERASQRDQALFGQVEQVRAHYWQRYVPGQRIYLQTCHPNERANVVIDNNDPLNPELRLMQVIQSLNSEQEANDGSL
jgi:uridine kinase